MPYFGAFLESSHAADTAPSSLVCSTYLACQQHHFRSSATPSWLVASTTSARLQSLYLAGTIFFPHADNSFAPRIKTFSVAWKSMSKPWKYILVPWKYISKPLKLFCCRRRRNIRLSAKDFRFQLIYFGEMLFCPKKFVSLRNSSYICTQKH